MLSILPLSALQTLSLAIEVDALSEEFDAAMIAELEKAGCFKAGQDADAISEMAYAKAYRKVGRRADSPQPRHCRTGSSESPDPGRPRIGQRHCRTGSSETPENGRWPIWPRHCRTGSSETW